MNPLLEEKLISLPKLKRENAASRTCKICGREAPLFDVVDFNKMCSEDNPLQFGAAGIPVAYYRCVNCDFAFTDFTDDWTSADYSRFIYNEDYIKIDGEYAGARASRTARHMQSVLDGCQHLKILDYGSGSGQFAAQLQRLGFVHVSNYDPFSSPERPHDLFDVITCFEVIEHTSDPIGTLADIARFLSDKGAVFVGETLQPDNIQAIRGSWWYLAPRNGHVSTYSEFTFSYLASKLGLEFIRGAPFVFARPQLDDALGRAIGRIGPRVAGTALFAPPDSRDPRWHETENAGSQAFRWTAADNIFWPRTSLGVGLNTIRIPFLIEIVEGFARNCRVFVDGAEAETKINGNAIVARISMTEPGRHGVMLRTPPPVSPKALGTAPQDERPLGLAIPLGPG